MKKSVITYAVWIENRGFKGNFKTLKDAKTEAIKLSKGVTDAVVVYRVVETEVYRETEVYKREPKP